MARLTGFIKMPKLILGSRHAQAWGGAYLVFVLARLYFSLCPSYLHPDEHFQGPEIMAGTVLSYHSHATWEFTSDRPVRSVVPLGLVYGLPMMLLRILFAVLPVGSVEPSHVFWALRATMFALSIMLEDRAIYELVESAWQRKLALFLISSSYVTWTWQVHTFSNSIETLIVLWTLVLIKRLKTIKNERSATFNSAYLALLLVLGLFTRITFPAYVILPTLQAIIEMRHRPASFVTLGTVGTIAALVAVAIDTTFYRSSTLPLATCLAHPVITPLNNILYNSQMSNLALHGLHPYYQHLLVNIPMLLGPAIPLLIRPMHTSSRSIAAISGICFMSFFHHQEARFLLPTVPLLLSCVRIPQQFFRLWVLLWLLFNIFLGILMGIYHQGGIVDAQLFLASQGNVSHAYWWNTYSPPRWLLGKSPANVETIDLMGLDGATLERTLCEALVHSDTQQVLVAPMSANLLDRFESEQTPESSTRLRLHKIWSTRQHLNLDDLAIPEEGLYETWKRVVGRRGLAVWEFRCRLLEPEDKSPLTVDRSTLRLR